MPVLKKSTTTRHCVTQCGLLTPIQHHRSGACWSQAITPSSADLLPIGTLGNKKTSVRFERKCNNFQSRKCIWKCCLQNKILQTTFSKHFLEWKLLHFSFTSGSHFVLSRCDELRYRCHLGLMRHRPISTETGRWTPSLGHCQTLNLEWKDRHNTGNIF